MHEITRLVLFSVFQMNGSRPSSSSSSPLVLLCWVLRYFIRKSTAAAAKITAGAYIRVYGILYWNYRAFELTLIWNEMDLTKIRSTFSSYFSVNYHVVLIWNVSDRPSQVIWQTFAQHLWDAVRRAGRSVKLYNRMKRANGKMEKCKEIKQFNCVEFELEPGTYKLARTMQNFRLLKAFNVYHIKYAQTYILAEEGVSKFIKIIGIIILMN